METPVLSVRACLRYGWETFKKRPWIFLGATALTFVINAVLPSGEQDDSWPYLIVAGLISFLITILVELCVTHFALKAHDSVETVRFADLWYPGPYLKYLAATLLTGLIVLVGLVLLIVPGIIAALMFFFTSYLVVDRGLGPIEALKESKRMTKGYRVKLLQLALMLALVNLLGLLCLVVGLLVSVPVSVLAVVHAYRTLQNKESVPEVVVETVTTPVPAV